MPRAKQKTPIPSEIAELLRVALGLEDDEVVVAENIIRHEFKRVLGGLEIKGLGLWGREVENAYHRGFDQCAEELKKRIREVSK